jgi:transketolase
MHKFTLSKAVMPTRKAFALRMTEYAARDKDFVVFEADIGGSTYTNQFGAAYPGRYFNMGIAEGNMVSAAAGMAAGGRSVVASSYGVFLTMRALESVRTFVCYPNLNVKFLSSHGGITPAIDGVTHQASEDIAFMITLPNMKVLSPCDTLSAKAALDLALETPGPVFVRLMRDPYMDVYKDDQEFGMGGSHLLHEGGDLTIAAHGDITIQAFKAAQELAGEGINCDVLDMYSIKPWDAEALSRSISKTNGLLVAENHQKRNGLGYEIANWCLKNQPVPFDNLGLDDTFAESGNYYKLLNKYGFSKECIVKAGKALLSR